MKKKKNWHNILLAWPVIIILIITLFIIAFFAVRFYRTQRSDYEEQVGKILDSANYQEAVIRIKSIVAGQGEFTTSAGININYLPEDGKVYMYKHVEEDADGNLVSEEEPDDFDKIFKDTSGSENITSKIATALNVALKGLMDTNIHVMDSILTATLTEQELYTPYKLELVNVDSTAMSKTIISDGYHNPIISKYVHELSLDSDSKIFYRFTSSPFRLVFNQIAGILILELLALILIMFCAFYLNKLLSAMKKTEQFREEFTHVVTHNMNNPITIALASAEALQKMDCQSTDEKKSMYLSILNRQLSKLSEQVKSILSTCEVKAADGKDVEKVEIDLYRSAKSVADQMMVAHPEAKITVDIVPGTAIDANPALFDEVLSNLIQNAIKYSDRAPEISLSHNVDSRGRECIRVKDNGKGIPSDKLDSIFDKFFKVEKLSSTAGYGLGLHFVKQAVEQHGWDIDVSSTIGEGSEFIITLNPDKS